MSLTVVGSIALDTVETPAGKNVDGLGGAAVYFSLAAAHFTKVHLVGVVGEDFPEAHVNLLASKGIDLDGLEYAPGRTFRWAGRYHDDVNQRDTLDTQLNVFETFHPKLPKAARNAEYLFLGNIHPALQLEVLEQSQPRFTGLDTMNLWIDTSPDLLRQVLAQVDALFVNDQEARMLTGCLDLSRAAARIREMGPKTAIIKKGEHGCLLFGEHGEIFAVPAIPLENVVDPTGAGDTFAGGFMGYLAQQQNTAFDTLKQAVVYGSILASFDCEDFGPNRLAQVDAPALKSRLQEFRNLTQFP